MSRSILVADDAAFMRMMIRDTLVGEGYVIYEAVNGADAVEKYAEVRPDLVMMDISMSGMNGLDALRLIRQHDPAARVLIVSALGQHDVITAALEAGALDFIVKPFQPSRVLATISRCLLIAPADEGLR